MVCDKEQLEKELIEDLTLLIDLIKEMLTKYGFGAKTTAGYGIAEIEKIKIMYKEFNQNLNEILEAEKWAQMEIFLKNWNY